MSNEYDELLGYGLSGIPSGANQRPALDLDMPDHKEEGRLFRYRAAGEDDVREHWHRYRHPDELSLTEMNKIQALYQKTERSNRLMAPLERAKDEKLWEKNPAEAERMVQQIGQVAHELDGALTDIVNMVCPSLVKAYPRDLSIKAKMVIAQDFFDMLRAIKKQSGKPLLDSLTDTLDSTNQATGNRKQRRGRGKSRRQRGEKP